MLIAALTEAAEIGPDPVRPFIIAGIAFVVLLSLGIVTWSYRDVANRSQRGGGNSHDSHSAGH